MECYNEYNNTERNRLHRKSRLKRWNKLPRSLRDEPHGFKLSCVPFMEYCHSKSFFSIRASSFESILQQYKIMSLFWS